MTYEEFLQRKIDIAEETGFEIDPKEDNPALFDWQNDIVRWALRKGKCAIFSDCGTGKTRLLLQWGQKVHEHENAPILILAPLAVAQQTKREGEKCGIEVNIVRDQAECLNGLNITNYEMLPHFDPAFFAGVILDESSIIKHKDGKTRQLIQDMFEKTRYKLCCTATPAPNDFMELGTHAQFLGVMKQTEMLATFFVHDGGETQNWRLKGHAEKRFFEWVAGWACCFRKPQDLGYDTEGYDLPELRVNEVVVTSTQTELANGQIMMFAPTGKTLLERRSAREEQDERHICPLQLEVIRRGIELWSNPGDVVLTPFMGIGSEAYMAVKMGRKAVGIELKDSYYRQAVANVMSMAENRQTDLFSLIDEGGKNNAESEQVC